MYNYNDIRQLHIEVSSYCQASCPQCIRNIHGGLPNPLLKENNISLEQFIHILPEQFVKQLNHIIFCGIAGDPLSNKHIDKMIEYVSSINPDIHIDLHTNGSFRNVDWWHNLSKIMPKNHTVHFGIDGLRDTHSIYRIGTDYDKIIENSKTFNSNNGNSVWHFIKFKHNEHQVEEARVLSKSLGFKDFNVKNTIRFVDSETYQVLDKNGTVLYKLEQPTSQPIKFVSRNDSNNYKTLLSNRTVNCQAKRDKSIYIDSQYLLWPCCYTANIPLKTNDTNFTLDSKNYIDKLKVNTNTLENTIESIVNNYDWQQYWDEYYKTIPVCLFTCGKDLVKV